MAIINHAKREINAKIVYYGPEGTGKTTSLRYVHGRIKPALRGELKVQATVGSELVFFDFFPFEQPVIEGYRLRFHLYTLHGAVANPAAWKMTLKGADGVVFVATPSLDGMAAAKEGVQQIRGLLDAYGIGMHDLPLVLQVNKADTVEPAAAAITAAELGLSERQSFSTTAVTGDGVLEVLTALSRTVLGRIRESGGLHQEGAGVAEMVGEAGGEIDHPADSLDDVALSAAVPATGQSDDSASTALTPLQSDSVAMSVAVAPEGVCVEGADVRIPIEITQAGEVKRLVLTVTVTSA